MAKRIDAMTEKMKKKLDLKQARETYMSSLKGAEPDLTPEELDIISESFNEGWYAHATHTGTPE
jgi:predicted DNA binding protein